MVFIRQVSELPKINISFTVFTGTDDYCYCQNNFSHILMGPLNCLSTIRLLKLILLTALLFSWGPVASRCIGKARHHFEAAPLLVRWIVIAVAKRRLSIRFYHSTIVITQKNQRWLYSNRSACRAVYRQPWPRQSDAPCQPQAKWHLRVTELSKTPSVSLSGWDESSWWWHVITKKLQIMRDQSSNTGVNHTFPNIAD